MKFISVGDNCVDVYIKQNKSYAGGCSVNFAIYIKQMNEESAYMGTVGEDDNGKLILDAIRKHGVDGSRIKTLPGKTAVTEVELIDNDRRFVSYEENVLKDFKLTEQDIEYISQHHYMHTSIFGRIEPYFDKLKDRVKICYDFADKLTAENIGTILDAVEYGFFSYEKDDLYIRDFLKKAYRHNMTCVVATLGANGSIAYDGKKYVTKEANRIDVVDTIGAGDSFIAGFMCAIANGKTIEECLDYGTKKAEETIGHFGAF